MGGAGKDSCDFPQTFLKVSFSPNIIQNFICKGVYLFQSRQCLGEMHKTKLYHKRF